MKFWKGNRLDGLFELENNVVANLFFVSKWFKMYKDPWLPYALDYCLRLFITDPEGLNSVFEKDEFEALLDFIDER